MVPWSQTVLDICLWIYFTLVCVCGLVIINPQSCGWAWATKTRTWVLHKPKNQTILTGSTGGQWDQCAFDCWVLIHSDGRTITAADLYTHLECWICLMQRDKGNIYTVFAMDWSTSGDLYSYTGKEMCVCVFTLNVRRCYRARFYVLQRLWTVV